MSAPSAKPPSASSEIMILPDGRILAHNLTPGLARLLAKLNPRDAAMRRRARSQPPTQHELPH